MVHYSFVRSRSVLLWLADTKEIHIDLIGGMTYAYINGRKANSGWLRANGEPPFGGSFVLRELPNSICHILWESGEFAFDNIEVPAALTF